MFPCQLSKGSLKTQNPDCIAPENCYNPTNKQIAGNSFCVVDPTVKFTFEPFDEDERCLLQYPNCRSDLACADVDKDGSIGRCKEKCTPKVLPDSKAPDCKTPNTTCIPLGSGYGACLEKK